MEWVQGTFANGKVTGFIIHKTNWNTTFQITDISFNDPSKQTYKIGETMEITNTYFKDNFLCLDEKIFYSLIDFALSLRDFEWAKDLVDRMNLKFNLIMKAAL